MIAETLSVGTELLLGQTVDTDAVFLAQMLSRLGITLYFRTTVGDNPDRIREALRLAFSRADLVITIGGLGPTMDDLTKEMAAEVLGVTLWRTPPTPSGCGLRARPRPGGACRPASGSRRSSRPGARPAEPQRHGARGAV